MNGRRNFQTRLTCVQARALSCVLKLCHCLRWHCMTCRADTFPQHLQYPAWSILNLSRYFVWLRELRRQSVGDHHLSLDSKNAAIWVFGKRSQSEKVKRFQCCINSKPSEVFFLPAKTFQRWCCYLGHIQVLVCVIFFQKNNFDNNNVHWIANCRIFVEWRNHIHDRQQIRLDVASFMKLHHWRISYN